MLIKVKQKHLEDEKLFAKMIQENVNMMEEVKPLLDNGLVFARKKSGEIRCLSTFENSDDNDKTIKHVKDFFLNEVDENEKNTYLKEIEDILLEDVSADDFERVEWDDKEIEQKKVKIGKKEVAVGSVFIVSGLLLFIGTGEIIWILLGLLLGTTSGAVISGIKIKK